MLEIILFVDLAWNCEIRTIGVFCYSELTILGKNEPTSE